MVYGIMFLLARLGNNRRLKRRQMLAGKKGLAAQLKDNYDMEMQNFQLLLGPVPDKYMADAPASLDLIEMSFALSNPGAAEPSLCWLEGNITSILPAFKVQKTQGCLREFCRLHRLKDDKDILDFALRWGVLGIWPEYHRPQDWTSRGIVHLETINFWRRMSAHFEGLVVLGAKVQNGSDVPISDWKTVVQTSGPLPDNGFHRFGFRLGRLGLERDPQRQTIIANAIRNSEVTRQEVHQAALEDAIERWHRNLKYGSRIVWKEAERTGSEEAKKVKVPSIVPVIDDYRRKTYEEWGFEGGSIGVQADLKDRRTFDRPMRPSNLLNILILQLIETLASSLPLCKICQEPFQRGHGKWQICADPECKLERERRRKKADYWKGKAM